MKSSRFFLILIMLTSERALAAAPLWSKDQTVKQNGKTIVVTCSGNGIAKDISFQSAVHQCNSIAASAANSAFISKSVVIETESQSPKLYSEISSEKQVTGLQPKTERELTEPGDEGFTTYIQVRYDLRTATVSTANEPIESPSDDAQKSVVALADDRPSAQIKTEQSVVGSERTLTISMLPEKCADYIIRGKNPRSFPCKTNPMQVMVNVANDNEIILRPASSEFLPKALKVHRQQRGPANDYEAEAVDVMFNRH